MSEHEVNVDWQRRALDAEAEAERLRYILGKLDPLFTEAHWQLKLSEAVDEVRARLENRSAVGLAEAVDGLEHETTPDELGTKLRTTVARVVKEKS